MIFPPSFRPNVYKNIKWFGFSYDVVQYPMWPAIAKYIGAAHSGSLVELRTKKTLHWNFDNPNKICIRTLSFECWELLKEASFQCRNVPSSKVDQNKVTPGGQIISVKVIFRFAFALLFTVMFLGSHMTERSNKNISHAVDSKLKVFGLWLAICY